MIDLYESICCACAGKLMLISKGRQDPDPHAPLHDEQTAVPVRPAARASHAQQEQEPRQAAKSRPAGIPIPQRPSSQPAHAGLCESPTQSIKCPNVAPSYCACLHATPQQDLHRKQPAPWAIISFACECGTAKCALSPGIHASPLRALLLQGNACIQATCSRRRIWEVSAKVIESRACECFAWEQARGRAAAEGALLGRAGS